MSKLRELREKLKMTQAQFSKRIGVNQNTIARWENGTRSMSDAVKKLICKEFYVNYNWLEYDTGEIFNYELKLMNLSKQEQILLKWYETLDESKQNKVIEYLENNINNST